jgi:hypothetical protein
MVARHKKPGLSRRTLLAGAILGAGLANTPQAAEAGYGSARGAVTSSPKVKGDVNLDVFTKFDPRKQNQILSILPESVRGEFIAGLKSQQAKLQALVQSEEERKERLKDLRAQQSRISQEVRKLETEVSLGEQRLKMTQSSREKIETEVSLSEQRLKMAQSSSDPKGMDKSKQQLEQLQTVKETEVRQLQELKEVNGKLEQLLKEQSENDAAIELLLMANDAASDLDKARGQLEQDRNLEERLQQRNQILEKLDAQPVWFNYVAAFLASCVSTLIMHPLDTIKIRQVASAKGTSDVILNDATNLTTTPEEGDGATMMTEPLNVGVKEAEAWTLEGYLSLYQGIIGALLKEGPPSAFYLGVYESVKSMLLANPTFAQTPLLVYLLAGAAGETVGSVIRAPAEAIKSRVQSGVDASTAEAVQNVLVDAKGRANVAKAWSASLWRDVPFGGIQLAIFEGLKSYIINSPQSFLDIDVNSLASEVVLGVLGGGIGALLTVPMDVVTIRILTQGGENPLGFLGMSSELFKEEGWKGFLTGGGARVGYWAPAIGIFLSCYCGIRQAAIAQDFFG